MKAIWSMAGVLLVASLALGQEEGRSTPAQVRIAQARSAIEQHPNYPQAYNDLALALARRARETGDPALYAQAEKALEKSFRLQPGNVEGLKVQCWLLLGKHEFAKARELARELNQRAPDDVLVYGFLADANAELGNYEEAEDAAQWMLDLRPGNIPGLTRAAYLREIFGDPEGALELMRNAYDRTDPGEREDRAWLLTQIGHLHLVRGEHSEAESALTEALRLFPRYHYALGVLGTLRMEQQRWADAVELLEQRYAIAPHPENLYPLAKALELAGRSREARDAFRTFERQASRESKGVDNANRELIFYYIEHADRPAQALRLAERESARRQDIHTLDAYAWALHANGRDPEAQQQLERVLKVGTRDPLVQSHAQAIAARMEASR
ncbi:tetratricopeptide repeat protein [Archangium lansingense]|uniref:Tetratricopeptide repeat protein n=1 Tax=Archangium lansingense TaxID=2995310 RepID=A0ABT4A366_9BACT|nr:tetratricopeptide repeat protein [Archangium lansinium]MCY1076095.1 tetratricopeptide repeat protein [Archangium lansinium]